MENFQTILQEAWERKLATNPLMATFYGEHRFNEHLPSLALEELEKENAYHRQLMERMDKLEHDKLTSAEKVDYDIFRQMMEDEISEYEYGGFLMPITQLQGFHVTLAELPSRTPFLSKSDYQKYLERLSKIPKYIEEHIGLMREGIRRGVTLPKVTLERCVGSIEAQITNEVEKTSFFQPLAVSATQVLGADEDKFLQQVKQIIRQAVMPAYQKFVTFMREEYLPQARETIAVADLPNGKSYYQHIVRHYTTLHVTPEEVHEIGHGEVKRIRGEMQEVKQEIGFSGTLQEFMDSLRLDARFYFKNPHELMSEVSLILKKMDGELPKLFKTLPRSPYGIKEIPHEIAPRMPTAYYMPPPADGRIAGFYFVNTYDLPSRPSYELEALSLHEAVPGHHLQIARQQELDHLSTYRRFASITAYVEGWALYAEKLGLEVGFYQDPYRNFGRLIYEMWRACRLVVDTGIHYLGWSREKAIEFLSRNSSLSLHNIEVEVDRYISLPGQAISYKMGEIKVINLRQKAEEKLGELFDIREFHDVLLGEGAIPLEVLEKNVNRYIEHKLQEA